MGLSKAVPTLFIAGDTVKWLMSFADYLPVDGWVLDAYLTNGTAAHHIVGSDHGDGSHLMHITATESSAFAAGDYYLTIAVLKAPERFTVFTQPITIKASLSVASDVRSHARKTLDAIEAWIESRNPGVAEYQIAGRNMKYYAVAELLALKNHYTQLVNKEMNAERLANGQRPRRRLRTRMSA